MAVAAVSLGSHLILVDAIPSLAEGYIPASRISKVTDELPTVTTSLMEIITAVSEEVDKALAKVTPKGAEVEIGIKFNVDGNVILAKVGAEGNLKITLKW